MTKRARAKKRRAKHLTRLPQEAVGLSPKSRAVYHRRIHADDAEAVGSYGLADRLRAAAPPSDASHAMLQVQRDGATKAWEREVKRNRGLEAERDRLHAVLKRLWDAGDAYFTHYGAEHEENCPEDDTCECPLVNAINEAFAAALPLVEDKVSAPEKTPVQP